VITRLSDVTPKRFGWLWPGYIALGKLTILEGNPAQGKSLLSQMLAARVSTGQPIVPGEATGDVDGPAGVILLSYEDGIADTVVPRLLAAGADLARVATLPTVRGANGAERLLEIPTDLGLLRDAIVAIDARLLIVDPVVAYLEGSAYRDQSIRKALGPLAQLAEEADVAVLLVRHLVKGSAGASPLFQGSGSIGLIATARTALLATEAPDGPPGQHVLAALKQSLGPLPPSLAYHIDVDDHGRPFVVWDGDSSFSVFNSGIGVDRTALAEAAALLRALLAEGPRPAVEILAGAVVAGVSERSLYRAKRALAVRSEKGRGSFAGGWVWFLPEAERDDASQLDDPPS
jgi:hypothetical protein